MTMMAIARLAIIIIITIMHFNIMRVIVVIWISIATLIMYAIVLARCCRCCTQ